MFSNSFHRNNPIISLLYTSFFCVRVFQSSTALFKVLFSIVLPQSRHFINALLEKKKYLSSYTVISSLPQVQGNNSAITPHRLSWLGGLALKLSRNTLYADFRFQQFDNGHKTDNICTLTFCV